MYNKVSVTQHSFHAKWIEKLHDIVKFENLKLERDDWNHNESHL